MELVFKLVAAVLLVYVARTNSIRKAPTVSLTPKNIRGVEKGMVYMLCNTTGIPRPNITLYKNNVKITNSRVYKFKLAHGWFIRIGPLKQKHQGTYRCEAANGVGPAVTDSSAILRVYQAGTTPSGFPRIGRNPGSQFKKSGDKVIFQCSVTGTPALSIMWLQNKIPLDRSKSRYSVGANGDLTIMNLEKDDKGSYACVAENSKGMVITRDARLFVREVRKAPKFVTRPVDQTVKPDSNVYLNCSAVGSPKPAIVWELDGSRISGGANGFLVIRRIQRSGNYTCIADNFVGRVKTFAYVKVKLLPFAPTRPTATAVSPNVITITWQSSGSHVVTSFVIEHKLKSKTQWKSSSIRGTRTLKISNLQPYSEYQFRVFALNSLGRSRPSPVAEYTTSQSKPSSAPINITAKGVSDTSFLADWLPPLSPNGAIRGYRLYYSVDQKEALNQWRFMASATNRAKVAGLSKQTTYFFKIAAYNMAGMGPPSQLMAVKTQKGVPGQPHSVRLVVLSSTSIQISWHEPKDLGNGIFGYEVYYNKSSKDMDTIVGASNGQSKNIMGLTPYTVYKFGVAAKSDKGIGSMSFAVIARTKEDAPSGSPRNINGKSKDSTTLEIKWDPPLPAHRNGIITDYTIKYKTKGGRAKYMTVDGIKTSVVLHNLKKFTKYFVWVSASTKVKEGPMSSKQVFSTAEDVPSGAPTQLKAAVLNSSSIEVFWSPPTMAQQDGNILGYMVFYSKVDDLGDQLKPPAPVEMKDSESETNLKVYLTNLAPETTYQIEVAGYTIKGDGARSLTKLAKTLPRLPDAPFVFTQKSPGNPSVVILGWRTSASDVLAYKVRYGKSLMRLRGREQNKMTMEQKTLPKATTTQSFQKLGRGVWYLFNVSLRTKAGWSPETAKWVQISPGAPTGPPLNVDAKTSSPTNIKVTWSAPNDWKRGGGVTKYVITYSPVDDQNNISRRTVHGENHTRVSLKRLMKYTEYEIRVKAVNSHGDGPLSAREYATTQEDIPGRPWNVVLKPQSSSVITLQWNEPRNPNGIILKYKIIYTDNPRTDEKTWKSLETSGTSASLRSLKRDEKYWVRVAAVTSVGMGDYSKLSTVRTLKFDLPGLCRNFKLRQLESDTIVIEWLPPEIDAGIVTYKISYSGSKSYKERGTKIPLTHTKDLSIPAVRNTQQSYKIENLVPFTAYKFRISATNAMGEGPEIELNCQTKRDKPTSLTKPEVIYEEVNEDYIPVKLSKASERNGPISYYLIVVVPLGKERTLPKDEPDAYFKRVKRGRRSSSSKQAPYIASKFMANQLPERFHVGEESSSNQFGYINKRLAKGSYYTIFSRAYVEKANKELVYKSSPFTEPVSAASTYSQRQTEAEKKGATITLIIILVVVFIVIIAVVALAVLCIIKRRRRRKGKKYKDEEKSEPSDPVELRRLNFQTPAMIDHPPIPVGELSERITYLKVENNGKFSRELESIEPGQTFTTDASTAEFNRSKNRYPNILAYDHTRVHLSSVDGYQDSDYINANFCDGYRKEKAYVATQGPLPNTAADFWRMIWQQRTFTIVMLTREEERGRVKCEQYWPNEGTNTYDEIEVSLVDWVELANYTITTLQISMEGKSQPREVKHFQFTGWPDHGVPPHSTPFLAFLRRVKFYNPPDAGPIVVHCSAGVGRTAIFIVIDSMLERIKHENTVDIYGHVTVLRTQRNYMVQTLEQYIFIHDALLEAVSAGNTEVHARNLLQHIKKLTELGKGEVTGLEEEFKKLIDPAQARRHKHGAATLTINRPKNRMANILPYESTRVHISPVRGVEGSDYINASFIDGYRQRAAFIATQGPLQDTVDDFWRMLMEQNSNIVVMMSKLQEGEWEKSYKYWPTERSARHQYYVVDPVSEQEFAQFVIRDFKVKDARNDTVRNIKQFHFTGWPETGVPKSGEGIIDLIGQVQRVYEQQEEDGPVTVHCSDGVGRTGVFCGLFIALERMRSEGVVDLFQTVKLLRTQRPAMVQIQEQYLFCYKTALEYLGSFDHYAT